MEQHSGPPPHALAKIAASIGALAQAERLELGEAFELWMLPLDAIRAANASVREAAFSTGRWHHQVYVNGEARAFARSRRNPGAPGGWELVALMQSSLPQGVDRGVEWLDVRAPDAAPGGVRLLSVPTYHLHALWLAAGAADRFLVVDAPRYYRAFRPERLYDDQELLQALRSEKPEERPATGGGDEGTGG